MQLSTRRDLAPDLARGVMLSLIALAHAQFLAGGGAFGGATAAVTAPDKLVQALLTLFVDSRGYPLFAALFGYGMVLILRRRDPKQLRKRSLWLIAFGFLHVVLLFPGDILASYGILALCFAGAVHWSTRRIFLTAGIGAVLGAVVYGLVMSSPMPMPEGALPTDPISSALMRVTTFPLLTPLNAIMSICPLLIGVWAARERVLENPALLRRAASIGIGIGVLGGIPQTLVTTGFLAPNLASGALHTFSGYAVGIGYGALFTLIARRLRPGPVVTALTACGQRSLTCYLAQSVAWFIIAEPYLLNLNGQFSVVAAAALGVGVWGLTVLVAAWLGKAGRPGPAEALLRRLAYS
ncbi:DUF418 domain-containing protein [Allokutzneria sp. A3M-2-11 16]|uniref:DUF418 domain-containing protein n=1 Tax=Allokutzneria sp. A3M-2-11 16 TaxID=2962043 RepID=UPI0020B6B221|nr:DUF418 domain-containing protein [Allokutzneria sp. A3M-2-11 16]MCP3803014.1 DUF418 domain-containing protein [Allokutzneria sp. A3M-2-11 16]